MFEQDADLPVMLLDLAFKSKRHSPWTAVVSIASG